MDPKAAPIDFSLITVWARERGYDQPYGSKPWLVKMLVNNRTLWIDLSATTPEIRFYNRVADNAIASYFETIGANSVRNGLADLLKVEEILWADDPLSYEIDQ